MQGDSGALQHLADVVLSTMADSVFACDERGNIEYINPAGLQLHRVASVDEFDPLLRRACEEGRVRRPAGTILSMQDLSLPRAVATGEIVHQQFVFNRTGEDEIFSVTAVPVLWDGRVVGAVSVGRDLTDQVQLERLKDQFVCAAAHELKTPLAVIKGSVQTVELHGTADEALQRRLRRISRGAERIDHVVTQLLDMAEMQLGRFVPQREPADLRALVEQAARDVSGLKPGQHIVVRGDHAVSVFVDRLRIRQVLDNLLSNAVNYSPAGGDIVVEVSHAAREAIVSVRDRGIGVPSSCKSRMFERFFRPHADTPYDRGGLGLGLHLSRQIVLAHGGDMSFESAEGVGSTFSFALPC